MKTLLRLLLKTHHQRNRSGSAQTDKGMTLVELLVGAIMAFLIITPMLGFVVDMLNTDRREQVKSNTEQDLQAALDFIAQDLSQAIYIYDNADITAINSSPTPLPSAPNATPILVFWKRKQIRDAVSVDTNPATRTLPINCNVNNANNCNDTYTRSLVAYYQVRENNLNSIWCQPSGAPCPTRIERYEISEGIMKNPAGTTAATRYFDDNEAKDGQRHSAAFNLNFDWNQPTQNVTNPAGFTNSSFTGSNPQVLVNYIDQSALVPPPPNDECQRALGNPTAQVPGTTTTSPVLETTLKIANPDNTNSFYACVDTSQNIARVTIRGNSLRRLQPNNAEFQTSRSAFFPTATVQVQGLGARGR
ncbi:hormogonium polysaccharide secretion pseudopilin HpsC [Microcoleus sp. N9_A1]|uniref:hormogonium polysaccharide secretion pseudopilin HpsC n=1 Tax=Microcoleus sp. N9_A1 TaxID=3055380 RepID=UPI002FD4BE14